MFFRCVVLLVFFCLQAVSTLESHADDQNVASLIRKHWDWTLSQSPVFAGQLGDRSGEEKLAAVRVLAGVGHREDARPVVLEVGMKLVRQPVAGVAAVSYTHLTLPTNREV